MMNELPAAVLSRGRLVLVAVAGVLSGVAGGCGPLARVEVNQPGRQGQTLRMHLESNWAHFAAGEAGDRVLLAWPLPGARAGRKHYQLYLRLPAGGGEFAIDPDAGDRAKAAGFLIQETGRLAGLARVQQGTVTISKGKDRRTGRLDVRCRDGTEVRGDFRAVRSDLTVRFFEDDHAADVQALAPANEAGADAEQRSEGDPPDDVSGEST